MTWAVLFVGFCILGTTWVHYDRDRFLIMFVTIGLVVTLILAVVDGADAHFYAGCKKRHCKVHVIRPFQPRLNSIAWCESRRHWHIDSVYDGGLQFSPSTWSKLGSRWRYAFQAPEYEQKYRAVIWAHRIGWAWHSTAGWPVCG
jgi:hypothetical protein